MSINFVIEIFILTIEQTVICCPKVTLLSFVKFVDGIKLINQNFLSLNIHNEYIVWFFNQRYFNV